MPWSGGQIQFCGGPGQYKMFVLLSKTSQLWWLWSVSLNKFVLVVSIWSQMSYNSRVRFYSNANEFFDHKYSNLVIWWKSQLGFWALEYLIMKIQGHFTFVGPPKMWWPWAAAHLYPPLAVVRHLQSLSIVSDS